MGQSIKLRFKLLHLKFKRPSGTSRGILTDKYSWILEAYHEDQPEIIGIGECSVIPGLSPDYISNDAYEEILNRLTKDPDMDLSGYPSIRFGLESALLDLRNGGKRIYFQNEFTNGQQEIPINGLVWMGDEAFMQEQIEEKLTAGFTTIKMKIGAIDLEKELSLLRQIRETYSKDKITLRVDANGAFDAKKAVQVLDALSKLEVHSIEQPIPKGHWQEMKELCAQTPTPIALDEELIGLENIEEKKACLDTIRPQYIILKPSLHGGISGTQEWIRLAEERNIGWWMTSALESNIGLNVIAQLTAEYDNPLPHGLGTGSLYTSNIPMGLTIRDGRLSLSLNDAQYE